MSFIGLMCLTLVVWTVMVTAAPPPGTPSQDNGPPHIAESGQTAGTTNLTEGNNSSLVTVCPVDSSASIENITLQLTKPANNMTKNIEKFKFGSSPKLCKCLCNMNMTLTDLQDAIRELKKELQILRTRER